MKVTVVGTGYVGLVSGTCFAEMGNQVVCVDNNPDKVKKLKNGEMVIYEPGLDTIFERTFSKIAYFLRIVLKKESKMLKLSFWPCQHLRAKMVQPTLNMYWVLLMSLGKFLTNTQL